MLRLMNYEEIKDKLMSVTTLINCQAGGDSEFLKLVDLWLKDFEKILSNNQAAECAKIAGMRGQLAASQMRPFPASDNLRPASSRSKARTAIALDIIQQATDVIFKFIEKDSARFAEAERIMSQLLSLARSKGLIPHELSQTDSDALKFYWKKISTSDELVTGVTSIEGLVGINDALIIFNRLS